jgi:kynureninase
MANIVGALPSEVVVMNSLTVNLHLLMVSFYRPNSSRYKIIMEAGAFPSDQYAIESQVKFHGYTAEDAIIELAPRQGELILRTEDILATISKTGDQLALVLIGGVQYFTGQFFNLQEITKAGHQVGARVGFDLAHAAGNVNLALHDWGVDFAVWCTYKYLNSGPGNIAGAFVHQKHENNQDLPRFAGWWGHNEEERFLMKKGFVPMTGADGWQLSNSNVLAAAAVLASVKVFATAGFDRLRLKSIRLTGYAEFLVNDIINRVENSLTIITPKNPEDRGCQLSLAITKNGKEVFNQLGEAGVVADWREPNLADDQPGIIRIAPVPLYNSFNDVFEFAKKLEQALNKK